MTATPRTTAASYWLWADRRIRISYNTSAFDDRTAAFLKIDVLHPRGAALPLAPTGHLSHVLRGWEKLDADRDYLGYAQRLLGLGSGNRRRGVSTGAATRQLSLF